MTRAAALLLLLAALAPTPLAAETCASEAVTARGENSRFSWTAKAKARANWRRRVRGTPSLGPDYDNWSRARDADERCLSGPSGTLCILTGTPCKI
jgi:hypothetical protein